MRFRRALCLSVVLICVMNVAQAQQVTERPRHPGDVIKFEINFSGPDANKVASINLDLRFNGNKVPPDQTGFAGSVTSSTFTQTSPGSFRAEITIPNNAASGDYYLEVNAMAAANAGVAGYSAGKDFQLPLIHIENPKKFQPPKIDVKEQQ